MAKFVPLHLHSHFSLLDGLPQIDALIEFAKKQGLTALALTDHGTMYGAIEFYKNARLPESSRLSAWKLTWPSIH